MDSDWFLKAKEYIRSDEGKKSLADYCDNIERLNKIRNIQLQRFHLKFGKKKAFAEFVEKVIEKYSSDKYYFRWTNRGIEPQENLYWFLLTYAGKYGRLCNKKEWEKYANEFTSVMYYKHGYYFNQMDGQGSVVHIIKKDVL